MPRACYARLCDTQFLQRRKARHTIRTERLKWQEVSRSVKWTKFCKNYSLGKDFAKLRQMFLKFGGIPFWVPARRRGLGRKRAGLFFEKIGELKNNYKITFPLPFLNSYGLYIKTKAQKELLPQQPHRKEKCARMKWQQFDGQKIHTQNRLVYKTIG